MNKEEFIKYLKDGNDFNSKYGFGKCEDFVAFDSGYCISKQTFNSSNGTVYVDYLLYGPDYSEKKFFLIQSFGDIKLAKNALKALTAAYK